MKWKHFQICLPFHFGHILELRPIGLRPKSSYKFNSSLRDAGPKCNQMLIFIIFYALDI